MNARWLGVFGCLLLCAVASQAADTVQNFDAPGTAYTLTNFGGDPADDTQTGPPGNGKCCRLTQATNSGLNTIAFDRTAAGATGHVVMDFDFRIGDSTDGRSHGADGIGIVLLNTAQYGTTGDGPQITEEASVYNSLGFGLDTWDNNPPLDPNDNHVSVTYTDNPARETTGTTLSLEARTLNPFGYKLHRATLPDNDPYDHCNITVDAVAGGANVSLTIVPAGKAAFTPINQLFIAGFVPYEMRVAFGARTGGENENHDIDNIKVTFAP